MPRKGLSGGCVGGRDWREAQKGCPWRRYDRDPEKAAITEGVALFGA